LWVAFGQSVFAGSIGLKIDPSAGKVSAMVEEANRSNTVKTPAALPSQIPLMQGSLRSCPRISGLPEAALVLLHHKIS
jgi:hypothetical protein